MENLAAALLSKVCAKLYGYETNKNELMDTRKGSHNSSFRSEGRIHSAQAVLSVVLAKLHGYETNKNELMDTRKGSHNSITLGANKGFALVSGLKCSFVKNYTAMK